jgi:tetratricopeptide (TPR) repeat protein
MNTPNDSAQVHLVAGDQLFQNGKFSEAAEAYRKAAELQPDFALAYHNWGAALASQGKHAEAIEQYRKAVELKPDYALAYHNWGAALASQDKHAEAIEQYRKAVELKPDYALAYHNWGIALANQSKHAEAIEQYRKAIKLKPDDALAYHSWGLALANQGQHAEAIEQYRNAVKLKPDEATPYLDWGVALGNQGKHAEEIEQYRKAVELKPDYALAYQNWGAALARQGKHAEAIEQYRKAIKLKPDDALAYRRWGLALANQGQHAEAIEQYRNAVKLKPNDARSYLDWGVALGSQDKHAEAIEQYRKAVELKPDFALAYHNWGAALASQGKHAEAIEQYRKALDTDPKYVDPYLDWANVLSAEGRYDEAIEVCQRGIRVKPDFPYAYHNIAVYLGEQGRYDEARMAWEDALQQYSRAETVRKTSRDADFFSYYGAAMHESLGKLDDAERILQEGLSIAPNHQGILISLGKLHRERHDEPLKKGEAPGAKTAAYWSARDYFRRAERAIQERIQQLEDYRSLLSLGDLYIEMQEYDDAKKCLEKARDKDREAAAPRRSLGVVASRREAYTEASQYFEDAHRRNPHDLMIWSNLAEVYNKLKAPEKAEVEFKKILRITDGHIDSQVGLGEVYTAMGDGGDTESYGFGITHFTRAIELGRAQQGSKRLRTRDLAALLYSRGYARVRLYEASRLLTDESHLDEALKDFEQCCILDPDNYKADRARTKLRQRLGRLVRH